MSPRHRCHPGAIYKQQKQARKSQRARQEEQCPLARGKPRGADDAFQAETQQSQGSGRAPSSASPNQHHAAARHVLGPRPSGGDASLCTAVKSSPCLCDPQPARGGNEGRAEEITGTEIEGAKERPGCSREQALHAADWLRGGGGRMLPSFKGATLQFGEWHHPFPTNTCTQLTHELF